MQTLQITGTTTYAENIRNLKIGDIVRLSRNPNNKISSEAIGVYTLAGLKVGYAPFKDTQIDIKSKYTVSKINLILHPPLLLLSCEFESSNFIQVEPQCILELKDNNIIKMNEDVKLFKKYLKVSGVEVENIGIVYQDDNYINLRMNDDIFYTITRSYYEKNIFKYDEFYNYKLIPKCIYQQFQIHRLEVYLKRKYKSIDSLLNKKYKNNDSFEFTETQFEHIAGNIFNNLSNEQLSNLIKLIVQYNIESNEYYNPKVYFKLISDINIDINYNLEKFKNNFNQLKIGGICYNHNYKRYCYIDLYDETNIIDISTRKITKEYITELLIKLIISNKNVINVFNPITGILYTQEISEIIKDGIKI
jgi:hypothetical protein